MIYLLDSDVLIDMLRTRSIIDRAVQERLVRSGSGISLMTYGELWTGVIERPIQLDGLRRLLAPLTILPIDQETMHLYAGIRGHLKKSGAPLPTPDLLIAATALQHGLILVSRNFRHFDRIPDLRMKSPNDL